MTLPIELNFSTRIVHNIKLSVLKYSNTCVSQVLAVVMEISAKNLGLAFKNVWTKLSHLWVVDSTQLECAM